jgi:hypothetical protein
MRNPKITAVAGNVTTHDVNLSAPKIRKEICGGVSPVSFWRWRRDPKMHCPALTKINGRLYGSRNEWLEWWAGQQRVA